MNFKYLILKVLDKFAFRIITDFFVTYFTSIPMKLGRKKYDYADLEKESDTYNSKEAVRIYADTYEKFRTSEGNNKIGGRTFLAMAGLSFAFKEKKYPVVVEVGGTSGAFYLELKELLGDAVKNWVICENPLVVDTFKKRQKEIRWIYNLNEMSKADMVYISGTLQFVSEPFRMLEDILKLQPQYIFIKRTPFWDLPTKLTKQICTLRKTKGKKLTTPAWIFNEGEACGKLKGYKKIEFETEYDRPYITGYGFLSYKNFLFGRRAK